MTSPALLRAAMLLGVAVAAPALAGALEVTPILTDVVAVAEGATSLTVRNRASTPATVQLRLMRWRLQDGQDRLEPTTDAGVSPPFITVRPGGTHVIRLVRTSKRPIAGEEAYRLLLDELPTPGGDEIAVALTVRHALPVFFRSPKASRPDLRWRIEGTDGARELVATHAGERRLRVAKLRIDDGAGNGIDFGDGLAGYALGGGARRWRLPVDRPFRPTRVTVRFVSESGPETAEASLAEAGQS